MKTIQKTSALLLILIPLFSWSQDYNVLTINSYHLEKVKIRFVEHPLLLGKLKVDTSDVWISVYTKNYKEGLIIADSIQFTFKPNDNSSKIKKSITIIPDTLTTFSSHIFAYMLYEGAKIFENPKNGKKPIFTTIETDKFDSLLFLDQHIDKKGRIWYYVQFNSDRKANQSNNSEDKLIQGWVLKGRTRLIWYGVGCY